MLEHFAEVGAAEGIIIVVRLNEQIEEAFNVGFVNEASIIRAEELFKAEGNIFAVNVVEELAEVVSKDIHARQVSVGVGVAEIIFIPIGFGALLHDVIPSKNAVWIVGVDEVKGRAGQVE